MTNEEVVAVLTVLQERYDVEEQRGGPPDYREALRRAEYAVSEIDILRDEIGELRAERDQLTVQYRGLRKRFEMLETETAELKHAAARRIDVGRLVRDKLTAKPGVVTATGATIRWKGVHVASWTPDENLELVPTGNTEPGAGE